MNFFYDCDVMSTLVNWKNYIGNLRCMEYGPYQDKKFDMRDDIVDQSKNDSTHAELRGGYDIIETNFEDGVFGRSSNLVRKSCE